MCYGVGWVEHVVRQLLLRVVVERAALPIDGVDAASWLAYTLNARVVVVDNVQFYMVRVGAVNMVEFGELFAVKEDVGVFARALVQISRVEMVYLQNVVLVFQYFGVVEFVEVLGEPHFPVFNPGDDIQHEVLHTGAVPNIIIIKLYYKLQ